MGHDASRQILLVEDDVAIRESLGEVLEEAGYSVAYAVNGSEALDVLRSGGARPDLILLDLMMPVMDGYGFCSAKNADPALKDVPVVIMSAAGQMEAKIETTLAAGHLRKPMTIKSILEVVRRHMPSVSAQGGVE